MENLRIEILDLRKHDDSRVSECYRDWFLNWSEAYLEIDGIKNIYSDKFVEFDSSLSLFEGNKRVGSIFFKSYDLSSWVVREHSLFSSWDKELKTSLGREYGVMDFSTHLYIEKNFRKSSKSNVPYARLLTELTALHIFYGLKNVCIAALRNERGVNVLCEQVGSEKIDQIKWRGMEVDIVIFPKQNIRFRMKNFLNNSEQIYFKSREGYSDETRKSI